MILRRIIASLVAGLIMVCNVQSVLAYSSDEGQEKEVSKLITTGVPDLSVQLDDLYKEVGRNLNIDYMYVKIIHLIAGGKAVYADKRPNISVELTASSVGGPFDIEGANQTYSLQAHWVEVPDEAIERPNKYYLPDAAYSTAAEVVKLMNDRYYADRKQLKPYFDALNNDVKTTIIFCEAMLAYVGADPETIESFYTTYEKMLYEKDKHENVVEVSENGEYTIKKKFKDILLSNNISNERDLRVLGIILSFDSNLAASCDPNDLKEEYVTPYKLNYTSRENMMLAAMSVVGKVRYVWGGGHIQTGTIDGINPSWKRFFDSYIEKTDQEEQNDQKEQGYEFEGNNMCIQPTYSWCPIHGISTKENGCLFDSETVYSAEEYVESRKDIFDIDALEGDKYTSLLEESIDFEHGVVSHRLDGLDCSGFASWLYNQISDDKQYDSSARYFIESGGLKSIPYGDEMLPGDVFTWGSHIVVVVGKSDYGSDAYVIVEASPNMVKFGVIYYGSKAKSKDITNASNIAKEANALLGNLPSDEKTNVYNMDKCGYSSGSTERYAEIGRLDKCFLDEDLTIETYGKKMKDMTAKDIIQYTINNLTVEYISGLSNYTGEIFDVSQIVGNCVEPLVMANSASLNYQDNLEYSSENDVETLTNELSPTDDKEERVDENAE